MLRVGLVSLPIRLLQELFSVTEVFLELGDFLVSSLEVIVYALGSSLSILLPPLGALSVQYDLMLLPSLLFHPFEAFLFVLVFQFPQLCCLRLILCNLFLR